MCFGYRANQIAHANVTWMDERAKVQIKKTRLSSSVCRKDTGHSVGDDFSNSFMKKNYNQYAIYNLFKKNYELDFSI